MAAEHARDKASFMLETKSMGFSMSNSSKTSFFTAQIMLRVFAAVFTLAAICVMVKTSQTIVVLGFSIKAHYTDSSAMRMRGGDYGRLYQQIWAREIWLDGNL
ncbi:hypothetical protein COLO4_13329 [Corchorus olitorius]|uniref:CASP-like protein n=1 Tax=Corchorus olitorius TaxID=93759 RepID=A0A1R3JWW2_9ROSI|nr:hypothetical protein COLO4_13329 [Corchorus olitorius]